MVGVLYTAMFFSFYITLIAQEVEPKEEVPVIEQIIRYADGKDTDSFTETLEKSATSTPESNQKYTNDQVIDYLKRIEIKLDIIIKRL